jgi:hypothetical protein
VHIQVVELSIPWKTNDTLLVIVGTPFAGIRPLMINIFVGSNRCGNPGFETTTPPGPFRLIPVSFLSEFWKVDLSSHVKFWSVKMKPNAVILGVRIIFSKRIDSKPG